jgi:hypothetical protein
MRKFLNYLKIYALDIPFLSLGFLVNKNSDNSKEQIKPKMQKFPEKCIEFNDNEKLDTEA